MANHPNLTVRREGDTILLRLKNLSGNLDFAKPVAMSVVKQHRRGIDDDIDLARLVFRMKRAGAEANR